MCGIVGYAGTSNAKAKILSGLKSLEYRGYDSAGIALIIDGKIAMKKESGELSKLEKKTSNPKFDGAVGIGHTRWATHGSPTKENSHPHMCTEKKIAIVHNGIIENYVELKHDLIKNHNIKFRSETDSEVIAHLVSLNYKGDLVDAVKKAKKKLKGAFAVAAIAADNPDEIVAIRKDAPLIAGKSEDGCFVASDIPALLRYTRDIYLIEDDELVIATKDEVKIFDNKGKAVSRELTHIEWDVDAAEKGGYEHFMLKEIYEQPKGIMETISRRLDNSGSINLDGISFSKKDLDEVNKIYLVACGTAYHAGMVGKNAIEKFARIPCETDLASEFRYRDPIIDKNTLCIFISQSGETSDTLEALKEAKKKGAKILSIVNVVGSSVARASDHVFYTWAGPEKSVASTKAYTTQLVALYLIALHLGVVKKVLDEKTEQRVLKELKAVPKKIEKVLEQESKIEKLAEMYCKKEKIMYIGRGMDMTTAQEASLKLKEITYINSFAIAAGELKHGTIALLTKNTLVIAIATQKKLYDKMLSNLEEIKARGSQVFAIAKHGDNRIEDIADEAFYIPNCSDDVSPLVSIVPCQLFAYYVAKFKGRNIDKPRNLAKSVTVE